jgi:hypothetical protein
MEINSKNLHVPKKKVLSENSTKRDVMQVIVNSVVVNIGRTNQRIISISYKTGVSKLKIVRHKRDNFEIHSGRHVILRKSEGEYFY